METAPIFNTIDVDEDTGEGGMALESADSMRDTHELDFSDEETPYQKSCKKIEQFLENQKANQENILLDEDTAGLKENSISTDLEIPIKNYMDIKNFEISVPPKMMVFFHNYYYPEKIEQLIKKKVENAQQEDNPDLRASGKITLT